MENKNDKIIEIPIDQLVYDIENPRIPQSIKQENEESVLEWMINKENVTDLMYSIGEKGFFPGEPLLVVKNDAGQYPKAHDQDHCGNPQALLDAG